MTAVMAQTAAKDALQPAHGQCLLREMLRIRRFEESAGPPHWMIRLNGECTDCLPDAAIVSIAQLLK